MRLIRIYQLAELLPTLDRMSGALGFVHAEEARVAARTRNGGRVTGFSYPAGRQVEFEVPPCRPGEEPNWRETLVCPLSGLNSRQRASLQLLESELCPCEADRLYVTEQVTPFFSRLRERYPTLVGSEYFGPDAPCGGSVDGVRNEDLQRLSFEDESLDVVVSLECFEHMPDYRKAFAECARVLAPGGRMLWTVPFLPLQHANLERARCLADGTVEHVLPAEHHGDPVRPGAGALCFTHFGWDMFDQVRAAGFHEAYALMYWSVPFGYLGAPQFQFVAWKSGPR